MRRQPIIAWNTVYIAAALDDLRADGERISDDELARLTPTLFGISSAAGSTRRCRSSRAGVSI
jgi:hypothetical protein